MTTLIIKSRTKITLVFEVFTDGPNTKKRLGDACRGDDTEFIESALQAALSELSLVSMNSIDVSLTAVHDGNMGPIWERFKRG